MFEKRIMSQFELILTTCVSKKVAGVQTEDNRVMMMMMMRTTIISLVFVAILLPILHTTAVTNLLRDTLTTSRPLYDGETLISAGGVFALGFFSPTNSSVKRYAAIWYYKIPSHDVVWVANRRKPVTDLFGSLALTPNGTLVIFDRNTTVIWSSLSTSKTNASSRSSSSSSSAAFNQTAQLLDTGNLIVTAFDDDSNKLYIWQSFDYPSDTMLPGMFIGWDQRTGLIINVTSWATPTDPSPGEYSMAIDFSGVPQIVVTRGHNLYIREGPYNVHSFANKNVGYYFGTGPTKAIWILKLLSNGAWQELGWVDPPGQWKIYSESEMDPCVEGFSLCGPFGICSANDSTTPCSCLLGFRPKNPSRWALGNWSDGCMRNTPLDCNKNVGNGGDGYMSISELMIPDTSAAVADWRLGSDECSLRCLTNCSCTAYSLANANGGCILFTGDLNDMRFLPGGTSSFDKLFVRVAATEAAAAAAVTSQNANKVKRIIAIVVPTMGSLLIAFILISCHIAHLKKRSSRSKRLHKESDEIPSDNDIDLPFFDFETIVEATSNFSDENKLGQGGFGTVYKGKKKDGKEIAIKRLSKSSKQGTIEFKNEVMSIAKLQHRNLVLLLGCCIQRQERILVYEYMENKSLDTFLFDKEKKMLLNWKIRYDIIVGIARGLQYLHQDSSIRVIHRDLKASNILLNQEMVPKISDFGLARIFEGDKTKSVTKRVAGTYGYMSPEYVNEGIFSAKSDVFSFGVIVLEVISNQRNRGCSPSQPNLIEQAWILWNKGKALELVDESIRNSFHIDEVLRCIKVGLLCVQEFPNDRPLMSYVILMLTSEKELLPEPKHAGFVLRRHSVEADHSSSIKEEINSVNDVSLTILDGR